MNPTSFVVPGLLASMLVGGCATRTVYVVDNRDDARAPVADYRGPVASAPAAAAPQDEQFYAQADPGQGAAPMAAPNYEDEAGIRDPNDFVEPLTPYGNWVNYPGYGSVFRPSVAVVGANFRPYTHGHWEYTEWGWTWVDHHAFGWATGHYGRWFYDAGQGWLWVPGVTWAPAWVSWRTGGSYIGWSAMPPGAYYGGNYSVYDTSWVFVNTGSFGNPYIGGVIITGSRYRSCYTSTYPQRSTYVVYGRDTYRGPDYNQVRRETKVIHRPIREVQRDRPTTRPPAGTITSRGRDRDDNASRGRDRSDVGNDRSPTSNGRDRGQGGNASSNGTGRDDSRAPARDNATGRDRDSTGRDRNDGATGRDRDSTGRDRGSNATGRDRDDESTDADRDNIRGRTPSKPRPRLDPRTEPLKPGSTGLGRDRPMSGSLEDTTPDRDLPTRDLFLGRDNDNGKPRDPRGDSAPTRGTELPIRGDDLPTRGTPTRGFDSPTRGVELPRDSDSAPTRGTELPTRGSDLPTRGTPTRGFDTPIRGAELPTRGADPTTPDTQAPTRGTESPTRGISTPWVGPDRTPTPITPRDDDDGRGYRGVRETPPQRQLLDDPARLRDSTRRPPVIDRPQMPSVRDQYQAPTRGSNLDRQPSQPSQPTRGSNMDRQPSQPYQPSRGAPSRATQPTAPSRANPPARAAPGPSRSAPQQPAASSDSESSSSSSSSSSSKKSSGKSSGKGGSRSRGAPSRGGR